VGEGGVREGAGVWGVSGRGQEWGWCVGV
jgi:hypothetical protein